MNIIGKISASLWNGKKQLHGKLILRPKNLTFVLEEFPQSHLNYQIPIRAIETAKAFLLYDFARNGLKITGRDGRYDLFIVDELEDFLTLLRLQLSK